MNKTIVGFILTSFLVAPGMALADTDVGISGRVSSAGNDLGVRLQGERLALDLGLRALVANQEWEDIDGTMHGQSTELGATLGLMLAVLRTSQAHLAIGLRLAGATSTHAYFGEDSRAYSAALEMPLRGESFVTENLAAHVEVGMAARYAEANAFESKSTSIGLFSGLGLTYYLP